MVGGDVVDLDILALVEAGGKDTDYKDMIAMLKLKTKFSDLPEGHVLRDYHTVYDSMSVCLMPGGGELICIGDNCIVIPGSERERLLAILHTYHQSVEGMLKLVRGIWFWPSMKASITSMWEKCERCQVHRQSKERAPPISKLFLRRLLPMDSLNMDFGSFGAGYYLVAVDRSSGYVFCTRTQDQSTSTAVSFVKKLAFAYGWPAEIRSDNGPAFRIGFKGEMEELGIWAETSGAYNPRGNGAAERAIKELKTYLGTNGALRGVELDAMVLRMNSTPSDTKGAGSASSGGTPGPTFLLLPS